MLQFISDNLATIIGSLIVLLVLTLIFAKMIRDKKNAKATGSCSGCSGCPNSGICHAKSKTN